EVEDDERREAAIASAPSLRPNFNPKGKGVTLEQLSKFRELHRKRLQIKSKSKLKKKSKDWTCKSQSSGPSVKDCAATDSNIGNGGQSLSSSEDFHDRDGSSLQLDNVPVHFASKKHQKLHWGLDTKERWERKANM
ncbi:hypothetical protein O6P43_009295, partial [Quillaja saponaria]